MYFVILAIGWLGLSGQNQKPNNKGAWFLFENRQYHITMDDVVEISKGANQMEAWKSYHLRSGENFIPINPQLWVEKLTEIITKIDGVKPTNLADCLSQGTIVSWTDDISGTTTNYGLGMNGKPFVANANFQGKDDFQGLNYKGYLILKLYEPCINILEPNNIIASIPIPKVKEEKPKEEEKAQELIVDNGKLLLEDIPGCIIYEFSSNLHKNGSTTFSTKRKKGEITFFWDTENGKFVQIDGVRGNLSLSGNTTSSFRFKGKEKEISFALNLFDQKDQICKTSFLVLEKEKTWLGKNWPWIAGGTALAVGTAYGFLDGNPGWYGIGGKNIPPVVIEPRTMPGGLDSEPDNGGLGLDSDSRSMGSGISGVSPKNYSPKSFGFGATFSFGH